MKKYFYGIIAVIFVISVYLVVRPKSVSVETAVVKPENFVESLSADGKIRARTKQVVYAFANGNIQNVDLKVGDTVKKGQTITKLDWDYLIPVKSPMDGVITKIYRESSGPILRGEPIFEVSNLSELEVVAELLTPDAVRLNLNGRAKIRNWGGEGDLDARIFQISRAGAVKVSALGVEEERTEVKLSIEKVPPELKQKFGDNYHVDVWFLISEKENVLTLPLGALFRSGENWAVYVVDNNKARMKVVQIDKKNERQAVLLAGLSEGEKVILFPGDKIHEGTNVK